MHWWKLARCYKKPNYKESLHNFLQARINMILWFFNRNKSNSSLSLAGFQIQGKRFLGGHKETMQMSLHFSLISQALFTRNRKWGVWFHFVPRGAINTACWLVPRTFDFLVNTIYLNQVVFDISCTVDWHFEKNILTTNACIFVQSGVSENSHSQVSSLF